MKNSDTETPPIVLVVDDDPQVAESHAMLVSSLGYRPMIETDSTRVETLIESNPDLALLLLDVRMPNLDGLELLRRLKSRRPHLGIVLATVVSDIESAVKAIKIGAYNYLLKPLQAERVQQVFESYFANKPKNLSSDPRFSSFITGCPLFEEIFRRVKSFAEADVPVLIHGETGTGKELVAQIIHSLSPRSRERFLAVNVSALSPTLFESELFGFTRGAFTGANRDKIGFFEEVGSGTLFLDEIGELEMEQQKKLLRVLQTNRLCRIGETNEREMKARLLFATNQDLRTRIQEQKFREDLYYRLANYSIALPPLREREGDITLLANYFLRKYCSQFGRSIEGFHSQTLEILEGHSFPGNVRELEGIVSGAVLLEQSNMIRPSTLPSHLQFAYSQKEGGALETARYQAIMKTLAECRGNQTKAAEKLGIARGTLNRLLKQYREKDAVS